MKLIKLIVMCLLIGVPMGCTKIIEPDESMFEIGMDELPPIHANVPFQIKGYLKNNTNHTFEIPHGAGMFRYEIYDQEGNPVPQEEKLLSENSIGIMKALKPQEVYHYNGEAHRSKEFYEFVIQQPGNYKIKTVVEFQITRNRKTYDMKIESKEFFEFAVI